MINQLIELMKEQEKSLNELLILLKVQRKMIGEKDNFGLEGIVDKMTVCSKKIAQSEIDRRKLLGDKSIKQIVADSDNSDLIETYTCIHDILNTILIEKETNDMLLKQELILGNKILSMINPNRETKTYNSYGNLK